MGTLKPPLIKGGGVFTSMLSLQPKGESRSVDEVLVVTGAIAELRPVQELTAEYVRVAGGDWPRTDLQELVKPTGGRLFVLNASLPARVEADTVRRLRESAALQSLFDSSGPDARKMPLQMWILIFGLVAMLGISAIRG